MKKIFPVILALLPWYLIYAQAEEQALSFCEALKKTMSDNPGISAIHYEEKAAEQERKAASGLRLPHIGITGVYLQMGNDIGIDVNNMKEPVSNLINGMAGSGINIPPPILGQAGALLAQNWGMTIQERNMGFVGATATLPVYTGGKINTANKVARINEQSTIEKGIQTKNMLVSELVERYYGLSLSIEAAGVRRQVKDAVKQHLEDAVKLEANGIISKGDRLYVEVKMAEAERELMSAELQVQTLKDALSNTINDNIRYIPVSPVFILENIESVDYFKETAINNNPQLNQVVLKKNLALENVKIKRSEYLPQVSLIGGASLYNYQISEHMPKWAVGAGVKLNIFDGLSREYKYNSARYTVNQIESIQDKASNDISVLIEKLYNEMMNYRNRLPYIDTSLKFADEYLRVKNAAFKEGMSPATDIIDAELNLAKIRIEKMQTAYYYDLILAKLLEAAGISEQFVSYSESINAVHIK